ncbi:hypothetical protein SAMN05216464_102477 [Mucilaginibacter pineti]|uniref:Uncharacterized protein n=1 Tax=Mucilaginibacter pineti TaxID=1391627 RepID=A0A1G6XBI6_9SPHI|nr:hypothetical protein SAMN05216464_102477 [Mucilaginibacter pineti]
MITNKTIYHTHLTPIANNLQLGSFVFCCTVGFNYNLEYAFLQSSKDFIK